MTAHVLPRLHEPRRLRNPFVSAQEEVRTAEPLLFSDSQLYAMDWGVRAIIYRIHFVRGKWLERSVIE